MLFDAVFYFYRNRGKIDDQRALYVFIREFFWVGGG